ncbi:MAG: EAL domain-containing protein [Planctomycetes bacterium]|nr:EAL domain-containing protein [Planctomycetota bacterium]
MIDLLRDIILVVAGSLVLIALHRSNRAQNSVPRSVWPFLIAGFVLLLFGRFLEMLDASMLGIEPVIKGLLQEVFGYVLGFVMLTIGLVRWMPSMTGRATAPPVKIQRKKRPSAPPRRREVARKAPVQPQAAPAAEQGEHAAKEMLNSILKSSLSGVLVLKTVRDDVGEATDFECQRVNDAAEQILGRSAAGLVGKNLLEEFPCIQAENLTGNAISVIETGLPYRSERQFNHGREGQWYQFVAVKLGDGLAVTFADISDRKKAEEQLRHAAHHDTLTGLPNRAFFMDRLVQAINRARRVPDYTFAVLFLDFDRFKIINDSLGHDAGDQLLVGIGDRLTKNLRAIDTPTRVNDGHMPARLGGDEFVILLDSIRGVEDAVRVAERLQSELSVPHNLDGHEVVSTASIGIVTSDIGYESPDDVIRDADTAMYRAKTSGKARHVVFDEGMHNEVVARLDLERELRDAVEQKAFRLAFEPLVALDTGKVAGFEALIRWPHETRGMVPPEEFISLAEELSLIVPLGEWALESTCKQLREWSIRYPEHDRLTVSVNLSRQQLLHPELAATIRRVVEETGIKPSSLQLEITETMVMGDSGAFHAILEQLRDIGVGLVMDDFGTGHSSLSCLHGFPINVLKLDSDFIRSMKKKRDYGAIVNAVVELAHNLNMEVVAEGVETVDQLVLLQALACDYAQGELFSPAVDGDDVEKLLRDGLDLSLAA